MDAQIAWHNTKKLPGVRTAMILECYFAERIKLNVLAHFSDESCNSDADCRKRNIYWLVPLYFLLQLLQQQTWDYDLIFQ